MPATHTLSEPISMEIAYKYTEFDRFDHSCVSEGRIHPNWFSMFAPIPKLRRNMSEPHTEQRLILADSWSSLHVSVPNQRWSPTALVCGPTKEGRGAGVAQGRGEGHGASPNSQRRRQELLRSEFSGSRELPLHTPAS